MCAQLRLGSRFLSRFLLLSGLLSLAVVSPPLFCLFLMTLWGCQAHASEDACVGGIGVRGIGVVEHESGLLDLHVSIIQVLVFVKIFLCSGCPRSPRIPPASCGRPLALSLLVGSQPPSLVSPRRCREGAQCAETAPSPCISLFALGHSEQTRPCGPRTAPTACCATVWGNSKLPCVARFAQFFKLHFDREFGVAS